MAKKKESKISNVLEIEQEQIILEIKDKVINEVQTTIKKNWENEISNIIEYEAQTKLNNLEKRIYKYKNKTIIKKNFIILLLLFIIALETKLLYDKSGLSITLNNNTLNTKEVNDNKTLETYIEKYSYLLEKVNTNLDNDNLNYLYNKSLTINEIDNNVKLNMAYLLLDSKDISNNNSVIIIKDDLLESKYNEIFNDNSYQEENFNYQCINFIYNKKSNNYMAIDVECDITKSTKEEIINIYENNDQVIIETILGVYDSKEQTLSTIEGTLITKNYNGKLNDYKEDLNKYKYTFIKEGKDYFFQAIEKIK